MKSSARFSIYPLVVLLLVGFSGCDKKKGPGPTVEEIQLGKLSQTWKATSVTVTSATLGTQDRTADYANFVLTISGTPGSATFGYSATGRPTPSPWLGSGTWKFGTNPETDIIRDPGGSDEFPLNYVVSETQLEIQMEGFTGAGYPGSRTASVEGNWTFVFGL